MSEPGISVQPLGARVLVRPDTEAESHTTGGLYIPETAKEKPQTGIVIALGDDEDDIKVKVGQKVLFPKFSGSEIRLDGINHLIIAADDLLAIIKN